MMKKYLLVSDSSGRAKELASFTGRLTGIAADHSFTSSEAGQLMESGQYSAMIVNTPLRDSQGLDLCAHVCQKLRYPVVLITSQVIADRIEAEFREKGIIVIARPIEKSSYRLIMNCLAASGALTADLREENRGLKSELEENHLVARAKALLIKNMKMTEEQAHKFIERQAMDLRLPKKQIARNILKTYYNK